MVRQLVRGDPIALLEPFFFSWRFVGADAPHPWRPKHRLFGVPSGQGLFDTYHKHLRKFEKKGVKCTDLLYDQRVVVLNNIVES